MKAKNTLLAKLSREIPMAMGRDGLALIFEESLTAKQRGRVWDLFPLIAKIETPAGYFMRPYSEPENCPAGKLYRRIQAGCRLHCYKNA